MHTAHSSSHPRGVSTTSRADTSLARFPSTSPLVVDLETPPLPDPPQLPHWLWAWRPLPIWPDPPNFPSGCGHGNLQGMLGYPPTPRDLLQGMLGYHLQCMLGYHGPCGQNSWHTLLKILPCPKLGLRVVINIPSKKCVVSFDCKRTYCRRHHFYRGSLSTQRVALVTWSCPRAGMSLLAPPSLLPVMWHQERLEGPDCLNTCAVSLWWTYNKVKKIHDNCN